MARANRNVNNISALRIRHDVFDMPLTGYLSDVPPTPHCRAGNNSPAEIRAGIELKGSYFRGWTRHNCSLEKVEQETTDMLLKLDELSVIGEDVKELVHCAVFKPHVIDSMYRVYKIPKESGGFRTIEAPSKLLKTVQRAILENVLYLSCKVSKQAMGFVPNRSILGNALRHCNLKRKLDNTDRWLWKMDMKDFFPSISADKVFEGLIDTFDSFSTASPAMLKKHMYITDYIPKLLGIMYLCTFKDRLPQGSPTSPFLSNLVYAKVDARITGAVSSSYRPGQPQVIYTRYADDITMSSVDKERLLQVLPLVNNLVEHTAGGVINWKKVSLCRHGRPMRVTGININEGPSISRTKRDNVRLMLHHVVKKGWVGYHEKAKLMGYRNFYRGVDRPGWDRRCEKDFLLMVDLPVRDDAPTNNDNGGH